MALGAATRIVDGDTDLDAAGLNPLDDGGNVYHSPTGGLNYRVTAATVLLDGTRFDYAGLSSDQAVGASVTTFVYLDQAGVLTTNTTGFPASTHIPLAEIASGGSAIVGITNRRPRLATPWAPDPRLWRAGRFYAQRREVPGTTVTLTADTLYGVPFVVHGDIAIDRIAVEVTTLDAGSSVRLGLYAESLTERGEPGVLLEDLATISGASTGMKTLTVTPTRRLAAGRYFVAVVASSVVVALRAYAEADSADLGWPGATANLLAASLDAMWRGAAGANAAASALPDPFPSTPTADLGTGAAMPATVLRSA